MRVLAPAKINLTLDVLGVRPDGYHEVETVLQAIGLYDELEVNLGSRLVVESPFAPEEDLVMRAARLIQSRTGVRRGAHLRLTKHIPVAAGLGGGSSDAAATLLALNEIWSLSLPEEDLRAMAASLGADVPFFLTGGTALGRGRGDKLSRLPFVGRRRVLLLKPAAPLATKTVFRAAKAGGQRYTERFLAAYDSRHIGNDLWGPAAAEVPQLHRLKTRLVEAGSPFVALSGTGPTLFTFDAPHLASRWQAVAEAEGCFFGAADTLEEFPPNRPNIVADTAPITRRTRKE